MSPLEMTGNVTLDVAASIAAIGTLVASIAAVLSARSSRKAAQTLTTTNGGSTFKDSQNRQELALAAILDGQRSLGHQLGEVRTDLGRTDTRLTTDIRELRGRLDGTP